MKGFYGKLLRINLSDMSYICEKIAEEKFKKYLGGKGLGSYLLLENINPCIDPLSPENKLVFVTGPSTGTGMLGSSRFGVYSKSPLTGLYAESYSGGKVAPAMRRTGFDAILLEGAATSPIYLEVYDNGVKFHDANHLWGKDTYRTEDEVLKEVAIPDAQAVVIGPAGENLVRFACIENNYWRSAGRTGLGAVMGSKNLKAMVFHGQASCEIADKELLKELIKSVAQKAKDNPGVKAYQTYGTTQMVRIMNGAKAFPTKYWSSGTYDNWDKLSGDYLLDNFDVKAKSCPNCFLSCGKLSRVRNGRHAGLTLEGPEYETIYSFGGLCCIDKLDEIIYLNDLCDRLGMDTITAGNLAAFAIEATKRGKIESNLDYGKSEEVAQLIQDIAFKRGIGSHLAEGIISAAKEWGLEDIAIHVKGMEPPGYEPRSLKGMGLAYATSTRGACHLRATFYKPELSGMIDPKTTEGKAELFVDFENRLTIFNTQILCVFFRDLLQWPELIQLNKAITGIEFTQQELEKIANDVITMTRVFNSREGATIKEDTLPKRFFSEVIDGGNSITKEEIETMVNDYYAIRGWNKIGLPITPLAF